MGGRTIDSHGLGNYVCEDRGCVDVEPGIWQFNSTVITDNKMATLCVFSAAGSNCKLGVTVWIGTGKLYVGVGVRGEGGGARVSNSTYHLHGTMRVLQSSIYVVPLQVLQAMRGILCVHDCGSCPKLQLSSNRFATARPCSFHSRLPGSALLMLSLSGVSQLAVHTGLHCILGFMSDACLHCL